MNTFSSSKTVIWNLENRIAILEKAIEDTEAANEMIRNEIQRLDGIEERFREQHEEVVKLAKDYEEIKNKHCI